MEDLSGERVAMDLQFHDQRETGKRIHMDIHSCAKIGKRIRMDPQPCCKISKSIPIDLQPPWEKTGLFRDIRRGRTGTGKVIDNIAFSCNTGKTEIPFCGKTHEACSGRKSLKSGIMDLPDDILIHVLSFLTMKEAGRTSVLAKRWRHLWAYISTLNFNSCNVSHKISLAQKVLEVSMDRYKSFEPDKPTYLRWVDQVVSLHRAPMINEFRIQFDLQRDSGETIDKWVRFAVEKRVKSLSMDMSTPFGSQYWCYPLPVSSLSNTLGSLELAGIDVTGEALETFLHNCPLLEFLSLKDAHLLGDLRIVGTSLSLKYLILFCCQRIQYLEISAPNLVYVNYFGSVVKVPFKNNPKLVELYIGGDYAVHVTNNSMEHSHYLSQMEALTLYLPCHFPYPLQYMEFPEFMKLKKLVIRISIDDCFKYRPVESLVEACPGLTTFVLQIDDEHYSRANLSKWPRNPFVHYNLKNVEIVGCIGGWSLRLALYLLDIAVLLDRIIVDPRDGRNMRFPQAFGNFKAKRRRAKKLRKYLSPGTDLVIL